MNILLIDDHALFREGLQMLLADLNSQPIMLEAASYESALDVLDGETVLDLVLLDLALPGLSDIEALIAIHEMQPSTPIIVLSGNSDGSKVEQVLEYGARGYIPKSSSAKLMLHAIQLVLDGGTYVPPEILVANRLAKSSHNNRQAVNSCNLTPRQIEVLHELSEGKSNKEIGSALSLTESTVRAHVAAILKTLGASNRTQAVKNAMQIGLINLPDLN
mgnify:CR=1 FL=1